MSREHLTGVYQIRKLVNGKVYVGSASVSFRKYGFINIYNTDLEDESKIYIEEWGMNKHDALEMVIEKCN